jgi:hypothetical protein
MSIALVDRLGIAHPEGGGGREDDGGGGGGGGGGGTDGDDRKGILRNSLEAYAGILSTVGIGITIDVRSDDHIHGKERDVGWTIRRTEGTHSHDVDAVAIERTRAKCAWDVGSRRIPSTMPGRYKPRVHHREVWYLREERKT